MAEVWERAEPQSPCKRVCVMHPESGLCIGCLRTLSEIAAWGSMTPEARRTVMAELPSRERRLRVRKGGRAGRLGP